MPARRQKDNPKFFYCFFYYLNELGEKKKKVKRKFKTEEEAKKWERNFLNEMDSKRIKIQDKANPHSGIIFKYFVEKYLEEDCKARLKNDKVLKNKTNCIHTHILPFFGEMELGSINAIKVRQWQNMILNSYNPKIGKDKPPTKYKPSYLLTLNRHLASIFSYAIMSEIINFNPVKKAGKICKSSKTEMKFWTQSELETFISHVKREETQLLIKLLFWSGLRINEALALTIEDFCQTTNTLSINKTIVKINKEEIIQSPKTEKSNREVPLDNFISEELKNHISKLYLKSPTDKIFTIGYSTIRDAMEDIPKIANVKRIRIHDLRHSHVSWLIYKSVPMIAISERLGHSSIRITLDVYGHLYQDMKKAVVNILNKKNEKEMI